MSPQTLTLVSRYNHKRSRQITTWDDDQSPKSNFIFDVRRVEFIFSQTAPVVCLPCKQTDFITRIIALFRVLLYRVSSKKLLKIENTRSNQLEPEFSFSFDPGPKRQISHRYSYLQLPFPEVRSHIYGYFARFHPDIKIRHNFLLWIPIAFQTRLSTVPVLQDDRHTYFP